MANIAPVLELFLMRQCRVKIELTGNRVVEVWGDLIDKKMKEI
jgi:hypothetical protein